MLHQPAAKYGPNGSRDRRKARPRADCLATTLLVERRTDNGKAAGHEQRSAHALNAARDDQLMNVQGKAATRGGQGENRYSGHEHPTAAK